MYLNMWQVVKIQFKFSQNTIFFVKTFCTVLNEIHVQFFLMNKCKLFIYIVWYKFPERILQVHVTVDNDRR